MPEDRTPADGNWSLITTVVDITATLPFEIASGVTIERATAEMRMNLKELIRQEMGESAQMLVSCLETTWKPNSVTPGTSVQSLLPEKDQRYYVLATPDSGLTAIQMHRASELMDTPLDFVSIMMAKNRTSHSIRPGALLWRSFVPSLHVPVVTQADLEDLRAAYGEYLDAVGPTLHGSRHPEIIRAHELLDHLAIIPDHSEFQILGLFAIVEMLITHNPKLEDRGDSISHQIRTKLPLLFNRFAKQIDIKNYFGNAETKKVWTQLYNYRSAIAHGGSADFSSGDFKNILKSRDIALSFLRAVVKRLIRHCYAEPELLRDLRAI